MRMTRYARKVMKSFKKSVSDLVDQNQNLVTNPFTDFTRTRKLSLSDMLTMTVLMSAKPIKEELYDYFDFSVDTASSSAFVQARDKILPFAFESLFHKVNASFPYSKTFYGFRLIAVDGSDLPISYDPSDTETLQGKREDCKGYNQYHINAAFDILNNRYTDAIVNAATHDSEPESMWEMVERYKGCKAIFIADRNYATWNNMEHIKHASQLFLIRAKDIFSNGSLRKFNLPDGEFDLDVETILTSKQTKEVKENSDKYRFLSSSSTFDFIDKDSPFYTVNYRIVRFKLNGKEEYESIITNLPRKFFTPAIIKELYNMRWGIEISFRYLKYSTDLLALHSKKRKFILQEIWARMILFNISMIIIDHIANSLVSKNKWEYAINVTRGIHLIRDASKRKGGIPPDLDKLIRSELSPIRPDRHVERKLKTKSYIRFNYRFS